jgi:putative spermidine/putrescine transport system permease protein
VTAAAIAPARPRRRFWTRSTRFGVFNAVPLVVFLLILFVFPVAGTLLLSLQGDSGFTLHWYLDALSGTNLHVLLSTLRIAAETALLSLVTGFLLASAVVRMRPLLAGLTLLIVVVPYVISALVRTYGWIILLGDHGLVNGVLTALHVPGAPFQLLYNELGVVIGMTSVMLPYSVLVLYAVMRGVDRRLLAAAASLGAGRLTAFFRVYLPLITPGVVSAGVLTFILSLGYYLTPALMGGTGQTVVATLINNQVMKQSQWNSAAALGVILLALTLIGLLVMNLIRRANGGRERRA